MVRTPSCEKSTGLRKGTWTPAEDKKLVAYVTRYGSWNWRLLPKFAGLERCGKSCRLRWMNYLRPDVKRGDYTQEEEDIIIKLHQKLGNRWSVIASNLPGRTDNEIKNYWHTKLKKWLGQNTDPIKKSRASRTKNGNDCPLPASTLSKEGNKESSDKERERENSGSSSSSNINGALSPQALWSSGFSSVTAEDEELAFVEAYYEPAVSSNFWTEPYMIDDDDAAASYVPLTPIFHYEPDHYFTTPICDFDLWS